MNQIAGNRDYNLDSLFQTEKVMIEGIELQPVDFEWIKKRFIKKMEMEEGEDPKECVICIDEIENGTEGIFYHPGCGHTFHWECIEEWFSKKKSCPMCRVETRKKLLEDIRGTNDAPV